MLCADVDVSVIVRNLNLVSNVTFVTPTLLARLPPSGAFLVFPAAGALERRFFPKMS